MPTELSALIERLLAKEPAERPESAAQVVKELAQLEQAFAAPEVVPTPGAVADHDRPRHRWRWLAAGALSVTATLLLTAVLKVETEKGTIVIKSDNPDLVVTVHQGKTTLQTKGRVIEVTAGDGTLEVVDPKSRHLLFTREFHVKKGGQVTVALEPRKAPAQVERPKKEKSRQTATARENPNPALELKGAITGTFSSNGKLILTGEYVQTTGGLKSRERIYSIEGVPEYASEVGELIYKIASSSDGKWYALAGGDAVREGYLLVRSADHKRSFRLRGHQGHLEPVAFSPDSKRLASSGHDQTIRIWDVDTQKQTIELPFGCMSLAFHPKGKQQLASSGNVFLHLWDLETKKSIVARHNTEVRGLAYTPDGSQVVTGALDGGVRLWDSATAKLLDLLGPADVCQGYVCVTPDGRYVLSADYVNEQSNSVHVWDLNNLNKKSSIRSFPAHPGMISTMVISSDGQWLLTACPEKSETKIWKVTDLLPKAR